MDRSRSRSSVEVIAALDWFKVVICATWRRMVSRFVEMA